MQMASNGNFHLNHKYSQFCNGGYDNNRDGYHEEIDQVLDFYGNYDYKSNGNGKGRISMGMTTEMMSLSPSTSPTLPVSNGGSGGAGYIEHPVSKLDTLAGVAIKYGVEVADIKKMNGLVTDRQMFALKSLQIPLPGRHPPSPCLSNGSDVPGQNSYERTPPPGSQSKSSHRKVSPAMSSLQGYYRLKPADQKAGSGGLEMAFYSRGHSHYLEDGPYHKPSPASHPPFSIHRKTRSLINGLDDDKNGLINNLFLDEEKEGESERNERLMRRRQKSEADFASIYSGLLMKEESSSGAISTITGKGLALRPKAGNRTTMDAEAGGLASAQSGHGDASDGFVMVRKSSSTPSLNDQDSNGNSFIWPTSKWSLKPDLQALSGSSITRPIFDGLPKPVTGRKNKTALD